jgi:hypothetical protein
LRYVFATTQLRSSVLRHRPFDPGHQAPDEPFETSCPTRQGLRVVLVETRATQVLGRLHPVERVCARTHHPADGQRERLTRECRLAARTSIAAVPSNDFEAARNRHDGLIDVSERRRRRALKGDDEMPEQRMRLHRWWQ